MIKDLDFNYFNERFKIADKPLDHEGEWSGLIRIKEVRTGKYNHLLIAAGVMAGDICTDISGRKCWRVGSNYKTYYVHRIIWLLQNGDISGKLVIDHINGNPLDNSIDNLRVVDVATNQRNRKQSNRNSSGVTGVVWKHKCVVASWFDEQGVRHCKYFNIKKLGLLEAFAAACSYREQNIKNLNHILGESGYSDRHTTRT